MKYRLFTDAPNIVGVRKKWGTVNKFDDLMMYFSLGEKPYFFAWDITTDPGTHWLQNPENVKGTAILVPGQYIDCWQIGLHRGKYKALTQCRPVKVYRDNDKDNEHDLSPESVDTGVFGINLHRAHEEFNLEKVDKYSAGCQVIQNHNDFNVFMTCNEQSGVKTFSYTLLREEDFLNKVTF